MVDASEWRVIRGDRLRADASNPRRSSGRSVIRSRMATCAGRQSRQQCLSRIALLVFGLGACDAETLQIPGRIRHPRLPAEHGGTVHVIVRVAPMLGPFAHISMINVLVDSRSRAVLDEHHASAEFDVAGGERAFVFEGAFVYCEGIGCNSAPLRYRIAEQRIGVQGGCTESIAIEVFTSPEPAYWAVEAPSMSIQTRDDCSGGAVDREVVPSPVSMPTPLDAGQPVLAPQVTIGNAETPDDRDASGDAVVSRE